VQGDVTAVGDGQSILVISERARVTGKVTGGHVIINGAVNGPVQSRDLLELQPRAVIVGDVRYEVLEMHQGATIDGELRPIGAAEKPALKLAASNLG
jgi:cytoskeletal protein CcmA (bactofilin family)